MSFRKCVTLDPQHKIHITELKRDSYQPTIHRDCTNIIIYADQYVFNFENIFTIMPTNMNKIKKHFLELVTTSNSRL